MIAIETQAVARSFKTYRKVEGLAGSLKGFFNREVIVKEALKPTSLRISQGEIIGLVGANGAGKTTFLKILSGLVAPTSGEAKVLGHVPFQRKNEFLRQISLLLGQKSQLWWDLTPMDSFHLLTEIYDLQTPTARAWVMELAGVLDCRHVLNTQLRRLSLGERMKMELIGSLIHRPKILFLDEPTIGLDILAQKKIREFLEQYVKSEKPTILLTSHYMDDITFLSDRLLLLSKGGLVFDGTIEEFSRRTEPKKILKVTLREPLAREIRIGQQNVAPGTEQFQVTIPVDQLAHTLGELTGLKNLTDLAVLETDFEDVIHEFMATESRVL